LHRLTDLNEYDAGVWALGERRRKIMAALAAGARTDKQLIEAAASELGISRAYCYRLLRRYRDNPSITALIPQSRGRVAGRRFLDPAIDAVVEAVIDEFYLTRERPVISALVQEVARRCVRQELKAPTYKAVLSRVRAREFRDVLKRRFICRYTPTSQTIVCLPPIHAGPAPESTI
jgi:putative transposase